MYLYNEGLRILSRGLKRICQISSQHRTLQIYDIPWDEEGEPIFLFTLACRKQTEKITQKV